MGPDLMETFRKQAERFGTELIADDVTRVDFSQAPFGVWVGDKEYRGHTVIVATGATAKLLGLDNELRLMGRGVSTCATCDGFFFKDQNIMVVGGGDSAMEEALYLSRLGRSVKVAHRRDTLRASKIMQERALKNPKIEFVWNAELVDVLDSGQGKVTGVKLKDIPTGRITEHPVDGLFIAIGHKPNTEIVRGQLDLLPNDYIKITPGTTQTSRPGVFGAGDVQDYVYRQAVTAAGSGCMAALEAERYLEATQPH
jgi:thioredoxin reductase (NADPH)